jgi:uncharacterized YccA/Bax inhibitor family protein
MVAPDVRDGAPRALGRPWSGGRRELTVHVAVALGGATLATLVVGAVVPTLLWRTSALSLALSLVIAALLGAVALGRAEWRREAPRLSAYGPVVARFLLAFLLAVAATS